MKLAQLALFLLALAAGGSRLTFDEAAAKNRPVSKVITLLKDMLKQLEKEAEEDEEIYDKMACWCETNDKEKTKSIADAEARISDLTTKIEELTANSARLNTEIKNLEKEVAANQDALDKATSIREKELAEFNAEEKDLLGSISALKAAITVLSKHHGGAFLQLPRSHVLGIATTLQHEMQTHAAILEGVLTRSERRAASAFIQAPEDYFDAAPTFKQSYAPQSGEIFGILRQMKETFEANLAASQKEEAESQKAYEELKAAKEEQIAAGQQQIDTKTQELADTDEKNAQAKANAIRIQRRERAKDNPTTTTMSDNENAAMTDKEVGPTIKLISRTGEPYELPYAAARLSQTVKDAQKCEDDDDDDIPEDVEIVKVDSPCLEKVVDFLKHYQDEPLKEIKTPLEDNTFEGVVTQQWYRDFVQGVDQPMLFDLVTAANFMAIQPLLDLTCLQVSCQLMGKSAEEIRVILNIPKLTAEEESKARQEHRWIFDD